MKLKFLTWVIAMAMLPVPSLRAERHENDRRDDEAESQHEDIEDRDVTSGVYTMDNSPAGNKVWAFGRRPDGALTSAKLHPTGGRGTGSGLGNQGAVLLSHDGRWLFVCNPGSDEVSVFAVTPRGLTLSDRVSSEGRQPVSLTLHRNLLYVLNAGGAVGGADSIAGFVFAHGRLVPLLGAIHRLSADNTAPAQIAFTHDGDHLVVTEKATALIDTFTLGDDGLVSSAKMFTSPAAPPFGFATGRHNRIFVTQAAGGAGNPGASSVSSYEVAEDGDLVVISDSVASFQTAACWMVLTGNEHFAFAANTPNDSISSYRVGSDGTLELLKSQAALTGAGSGPADMALSRDNRFFYGLTAGRGAILSFRLNAGNGELQPLSGGGTVPTTANGLAAQ